MKKNWKAVLTAVLICCFLGTLTAGIFAADDLTGTPEPETLTEEASSESVTEEEPFAFTYTVNSLFKTASITGYTGNVPSELVIPAEIDGYSLLMIASGLFKDCTQIKSVIVEDYVRFGASGNADGVFENCTSLESVEIRGNSIIYENSFKNCTALKTVTFPETGSTAIYKSAFEGCTSLQTVSTPASMSELRESAFAGCSSLEEFTVPEGVKNVRSQAFANCSSLKKVSLPSTVTELGSSVFKNCTSLQEATIGGSFTRLPTGTFENCSSLTSVTLPDTIQYMHSISPASAKEVGAFSGCSSLETLVLPASLVSIGDYAFTGCTALRSVSIPEGVTYINYQKLFADCPNMESFGDAAIRSEDGVIYSPDKTEVLGAIANENITEIVLADEAETITCNFLEGTYVTKLTIGENVKALPTGLFQGSGLKELVINASCSDWGALIFAQSPTLETVTLGDKVTAIPITIFYNCTGLKKVVGGQNVAEIKGRAFGGCNALETVDFGENIVSIAAQAFADCTSLTTLPIGEKTESILYEAFDDCSSLNGVLTLGDAVTTLQANAFYGCKGFTELKIGNGLTELPDYAFANCTGLTDIVIPGNIRTIGKNCFANGKPVSVVIEDGVETISDYAFTNNASTSTLRTIRLPNTLKTVGAYAFYNHLASEIVIPRGVESIGAKAFISRVNNWKVYYYPDALTFADDSCPFDVNTYTCNIVTYAYEGSAAWEAFENCPYVLNTSVHTHEMYNLCSVDRHTPAEVCAFETVCRYCGEVISGHTDEDGDTLCDICGLSVTEPPVEPIEPETPDCILTYDDGILSVSGNAIQSGDCADEISVYADEVKTIVFENGFTSLGNGVFSSMSALQMVYIPGSVSSIGDGVFADCPNLGNLLMLSDSIAFSADTFDSDASFNLFLHEDAAVTGLENLPAGVNVIRFAFDGETLSFTGHISADMYNLFDIASLFSLAYDNIMTLHFEQFTAVDFQVFGRYEDGYNTLRRTEFENVDFSIKVLVDGSYQTVSFNEVYEMAADGYGDYYYLVTETDEENIDYDDTQISVVEQIREIMARIVSAIVKLLNKLFAFFKKITGK